jgi:hypothetical protein
MNTTPMTAVLAVVGEPTSQEGCMYIIASVVAVLIALLFGGVQLAIVTGVFMFVLGFTYSSWRRYDK